MAGGSPDLVDCAQLAVDGTVLERSYDLKDLPRLADVLADSRGVVHARFVFSKLLSGRSGASVEIQAQPRLRCQRCMSGFALEVSGGSEIEFADNETARASEGEREIYQTDGGRVSLKDLAEEELLLALPIVPACDAPESCGNAPGPAGMLEDAERAENSDAMRRPFGGLKDLLKKT
ncbi:MAG TPA: YceD family protein [Steroidobacteraceae bacterium]|jgi:uncharacterized protein|nr:YceD family protein [Steroidobacteraceae bacterium]